MSSLYFLFRWRVVDIQGLTPKMGEENQKVKFNLPGINILMLFLILPPSAFCVIYRLRISVMKSLLGGTRLWSRRRSAAGHPGKRGNAGDVRQRDCTQTDLLTNLYIKTICVKAECRKMFFLWMAYAFLLSPLQIWQQAIEQRGRDVHIRRRELSGGELCSAGFWWAAAGGGVAGMISSFWSRIFNENGDYNSIPLRKDKSQIVYSFSFF